MYMKVNLANIMEGMELQSYDNQAFINLKSGEIVYISQTALLIAEDGEDFKHLSEWQQEEIQSALDITRGEGKYVRLPTSFNINEYEIMENFCFSLPDADMQDALLSSIRGKGAFRRFKDNIYRFGIAEKWYDYRDTKYKEIAVEFCERYNISYIE